MTLQEIQAYLETNKDNAEVKNYLTGLSKVTLEGAENFIQTEDGKKWVAKHNDSFFTKGLESWKKNNLEKLISDEVAKRNPSETPEQKMIRELQERLNQKDKAEQKQALLNKSYLIADQKKLPKDILSFFVGESEEEMTKNLETLENVLTATINKAVQEKIRVDGSYTPPVGSNDPKTIQEQFKNSLGGF